MASAQARDVDCLMEGDRIDDQRDCGKHTGVGSLVQDEDRSIAGRHGQVIDPLRAMLLPAGEALISQAGAERLRRC